MVLSRSCAALVSVSFVASLIVAVPTAAMAEGTNASVVLAGISVTAEDTSPYDRDDFQHWIDADGDGCDTRAEVLKAESTVAVTYSSGCTVATGRWESWYDDGVWTEASDVDIDHMVPLHEAWQSGAWSWTDEQRKAYANDLTFEPALEAVTDNVNQSKGDRDVAGWMPTAASATCRYLEDWILTKYRWGLSIDTAEQLVLQTQLVGDCANPVLTLPARADVNSPTTTGTTSGGEGSTAAVVAPAFSDVPASHQYFDEISWLASTGITTGYSDGTFKWSKSVSRQAMAAFLNRFAEIPAYNAPLRPTFSDVKTSHQYYEEIAWLASTGITKGYSDGTFKWGKTVSRQAMAAFLYRFAGSPAYTPPARSVFSDVSTSHQYYKEISWLASTGITTGYSDGTFKWDKSVSRQAMAAFLYRFNDSFGAPTFEGPASPGDTKNCTDFTTWSSAQAWFETYYPYYGDIAKLDGDNDGTACVSLPGAP